MAGFDNTLGRWTKQNQQNVDNCKCWEMRTWGFTMLFFSNKLLFTKLIDAPRQKAWMAFIRGVGPNTALRTLGPATGAQWIFVNTAKLTLGEKGV